MRLAIESDIPILQDLYQESRAHAFRVGFIDWPERFSAEYLEEFIEADQLYCFEDGDTVTASVKLARSDRVKIWPDDSKDFLYVGKLATADAVRGQGYVQRIVLPSIEERATEMSKIGTRLNVLASNERLRGFYENLGFELVSIGSVVTELTGRTVETAQYQRAISSNQS